MADRSLSSLLVLTTLLALPLLTLHAQRIDPRHPEFIYFPELGRMVGTNDFINYGQTVYPVGDVDHDGLADWIFAVQHAEGSRPKELWLYRGERGGLPLPDSAERIGPTEINAHTYFIAAGDWDGDTFTDLATEIAVHGDTSGGNTHGYEVSRVVIWWGNSSGQYTLTDTSHLSSGTTVWGGVRAGIGNYRTPDGVNNLVFWTWGQGLTNGEIINTPKVMIFRGHRGGRWGRNGIPRTADWGWWTPPEFRRFTAIDQNCDGAVDLVFHHDINSLEKPSAFSILYGTPGGGLPDTTNLMTLDMASVNGHAALLSDISGDGVPELLISCLDEVMRIYAGEPGVKIDEQFGSGDDPSDPEHGRWYRKPWAEVPLPRSMHDGWAYAGSLPPLDLGDANLDGINDIFTRSWPFLIEYNTTVLGGENGVWYGILDSMIDGMYRAPGEEILNTVVLGDIDGSGVPTIAVSYKPPFPGGVAFIKPTKALPETGPLRRALHGPGVRCQGVATVEQPIEQETTLQFQAVPNPATGNVRLQWTASDGRCEARLMITDILGREVTTLTSSAGTHVLTWNAAGLPGGRYYVTLTIGERSTTTAVLLTR